MPTQQTITLFGTVSNSATSRISKNSRRYTAFGVAVISDRNLQAFHYNVIAFGKQGHFAKSLQAGTRIELVVQAQSQPDNMATLPVLTATFVGPARPVTQGKSKRVQRSVPKSGIHILISCVGKDLGKTVENTISSLLSTPVVPWVATNAESLTDSSPSSL